MGLSPGQVDFFRENGFVSYGRVLEAEELEALRQEYDRVFERAMEERSCRNLGRAHGGRDDESESEMYQIMQMCDRSLPFRRLLYHERILDAVQDLIGPNIMLFHDQALFKPAHTGGPVFWHQDNAYWRCSPANLVSCWLTLDDVDGDNGAMQLIPGSHLKPLRHEKSEATDALLDLGKTADASRAVVVDLPAGGCMFHHCQTLHYTAPNHTDRQRRAFAIHFMPPGTKSGSGEVMHVSFHRPLLRMLM